MVEEKTQTASRPEHEVRLEKLQKLQALGIDAYPAHVERSHSLAAVNADFAALEKSQSEVCLAGRLLSIRGHGGSTFAHLADGTGQLQVYFKLDEVGEKNYQLLTDLIDVGDFLQVAGALFVTKKGEATLKVKNFKLLSKTLLPLPEKWHGLQDEEERYRKRYLDILSNPAVKDLLVKKTLFWQAVREFLIRQGFLEVETPILENTTGGADARPFITHHNALDLDVYLRISAGELWQKKLMVAGLEKTFEIGRVFRNEGMDSEHLQDYTQMEFYWAYADWRDGMRLVEKMVKEIAQRTFGALRFSVKGFDIDLQSPWATYDYRDEVKKITGIDIEQTTVEEVKEKLRKFQVSHDDFNNLARGIDQLWKYCRKQISGPGFLIFPPKAVSPLAKESKERPGYVEQYQLILGGSEMCKGYSELNDPLDQEERFRQQQALREAGDDEAQMMDDTFVTALQHGMPPTTGLGFSERLFAFLADKTLRECQFFPLMKPKND